MAILKELDPFQGEGKFRVAGHRAEEQMAFYLRRFFANSPNVDVLNHLRIQLGGEIAQMDHLVVHPYGFIIVESKSVTGSVQIKDDGQWIRWYERKPSGMQSPVTQARMQGMLLKELLSSKVRQQGFFDQIPVDVLVAISDQGTIQWPNTGALVEVCKADQVPERVGQWVSRFELKEKNGTAARVLPAEHRQRIAAFLQAVHQPLVIASEPRVEAKNTVTAQATASSVKGELPKAVCSKCTKSDKLEIRYGHSYFFHCGHCESNSPLRFSCPQCGGLGKLRKNGSQFFAECQTCDASVSFFKNPN
jgi:hypothetical protein